ncbi:zinc metalloprotease HtpX [Arthrobacter pityocampae]|uniref:Protease HtpX homolog n=1 Tax=Arthrobacter pityocampae TaxID=547334 RepID=A0A2S5IWR0_9MICC|nr:zinc metalloprotease HtpX [Arthrobacter pityocampae]PPB48995.1 zinc metalloprotease HtpX [Arthrobacter pityocampae]
MHNHFNGAKTALLFGALMGIFLVFGAVIAGATGSSMFIWLFALLGVGSIAYSYWNSDKIAIRSMQAVEVTEQQQPAMYRIVRELSARANKPMPRLYVSPTMAPNAFATGRNPENAAVCCTQGILRLLDERELRGVLGHELMHVYNRDILTGSIAAAVAGVITSVAQMFAFAGIMGGNRNQGGNPIAALLLAFLAPLAAALIQTAIGRTREYDADEDGAALTDDPLALASALRKLERGTQRAPLPKDQRLVNTSHLMIANPFKGGGAGKLFATHPPMDQRIARLEGMAGRPLTQ